MAVPTTYYDTESTDYPVNRYYRQIKGGRSAICNSSFRRIGCRAEVEAAAYSKTVGVRILLALKHKGKNA